MGLGPAHDWSSHAADAFGLACVFHEARPRFDEDEEDRGRSDVGRSRTTGY